MILLMKKGIQKGKDACSSDSKFLNPSVEIFSKKYVNPLSPAFAKRPYCAIDRPPVLSSLAYDSDIITYSERYATYRVQKSRSQDDQGLS